MTNRFHLDRRMVVGGVTGLGLASAGASFAASPKPQVDGKTSWSESIMVVHFSDDLKTGFSFRICRFPDLNDTWVWCTVIVDGEIYSYTDQYLPCAANHNEPQSHSAIYSVPGLSARMTRVGTSADIERISFSFRVGAHAGTDPHEGPGPIPIALEGVFHPERLHARMAPGRFERMGRAEASLRVGSKRRSIVGVCKQHEQTQMAPRFSQSFTYCDLWNDRASLLGLLTAGASGGDFEVEGKSRPIQKFSITKPDRERRFAIVFADGGTISGVSETAISYGVPAFQRIWLGHILTATVAGQTMVGMINDWKPQDQPYSSDL